MKARIPFKTQLSHATNQPIAYISEKKGNGILTLTIEVDLNSSVKILQDNDGATQPIKDGNREALMGKALFVSSANITELSINTDDPASPECNFIMEATIDTKVPGTGS